MRRSDGARLDVALIVDAAFPGVAPGALSRALAYASAHEATARVVCEITLGAGGIRALGEALDAFGARPFTPWVRLGMPRLFGRISAFLDEAPSYGELTAALAPLLIAAPGPGRRLSVRAEPDIPPCLAPGALYRFESIWPANRARGDSRPIPAREGGRAYARTCDRCALEPRCRGFSEAYFRTFEVASRGVRPVGGRRAEPAPASAGAMAPASIDEPWQDRARARLVGEPLRVLRMTELVPARALPHRVCVLPWTSLEVDEARAYGPCCFDYQADRGTAPPGASVADMWHSERMRRFRAAIASGDPARTCRTTCPRWRAGSQSLERHTLRGGRAESVEAQLRTAEAIIEGREILDSGPSALHWRPTTFCNYNCVMCEYGERGTIDDEQPAAFYASLPRLMPQLRLIEVSGGEPLASPVFRAFLGEFPFDRHPDLALHMTTNGSYLTPGLLETLARVAWTDLTVSLNAATPETYLRMNRGLPFERVRAHLDELVARYADGRLRGRLRYSMVLLRGNYHEIEAFVALAMADGAGFRFMLPQWNRNGSSIMVDAGAMASSVEALERVMNRYGEDRRAAHDVGDVMGVVSVLAQRLRRGILRPLPDA